MMSGEILYFLGKSEESGYFLVKNHYDTDPESNFRSWGDVVILEKNRRSFFLLIVEEIRKILLKDLFKENK
uniref:Uncharacterized protein n=1 Tax=viral metagenome TaxID=1070528 RepID=A0A6M3LGU7_9ZZZZ